MEGLTIGQVAQQTGVQASALRYYERVGLLPPPRRVSGQRRYAPQVVQLVNVIQLAKYAGFTIAEIQTLMHGFAPETPPAIRWRQLAREKLDELELRMQRIQQMQQVLQKGLECGCLRLEDCVIELEKGCVQAGACAGPESIAFEECGEQEQPVAEAASPVGV